jgi:hypothetical protein
VCVQRTLILAAAAALVSVPAAAATLTVCSSGCAYGSLQSAIDAAQPGDTILLRAGETYVGNFVLRAKAAGATAAITIRSDAPASSLPADGVRLVPAGRPGANTERSALARLTGPGGIWKTTPVLSAEPRAHHYTLRFLEIDGVSQEGWQTLVQLGSNTPEQASLDRVPYAIVLDRVFIHGHPVQMQKRCVALDGRDLELRNSYVVECGSPFSDAQAVAGFNAPGPLRIVNNHLEGTSENIMFGGADPYIPGLVPTDIEIRRNHITKPASWREPILAAPSAAPSLSVSAGAGVLPPGSLYFTVTAIMPVAGDPTHSAPSPEAAISIGSANSAVVLHWPAVAGATRYRINVGSSPGGQNRYVQTPDASTTFVYRGGGELAGAPSPTGTRWNVKNLIELKNAQHVVIEGNVIEHVWASAQTGYAIVLTPRNQDGTAPWSAVRDVTVASNVIRHVGGGFNILGWDNIHPSQRAERITIRNNLVYDVSYSSGSAAQFVLMTGSPYDVTVDHNTIEHEGNLVLIDAGASGGFEFTNNLAPHNAYGIFGSGAGIGNQAIAAYFPGAIVTRNALGGGPASMYPPGNLFPDMPTYLASFQSAGTDDFRLVSGSAFRGAGTDGKDLGVDFAALIAALPAGIISGESGGGGPSPTPAIPLPGTIEAEDFDAGAPGAAYLDTTTGNDGGQYRSTDVDIEADGAGGYDVAWAFAGEWLRYTVNVAAAGSYDIEVRVASAGAGGRFHIEANGVDKTGPLTVPDTGGWQSWTSVYRRGVALAAGQQVWRIVLDANGATRAVGNFNAIRVTPSTGGSTASRPYGGAPVVLPGTLQAEHFDLGGEGVAYHDLSSGNEGGELRNEGVDVEPANDAGGGHNVGWMFAGEWLNYSVTVATAGTYDLELRVASLGPGGTFHVEVNGVDRTGPITIPDTGSWQVWTTVRRTGLTVSAGDQIWRIVMDTNGASGGVGNINLLRVPGTSSPPPPPTGGDIVLYSSDVATLAGNWSRLPSTTGAGGAKIVSADMGWASAARPLAAPADYFEARFVPEANRPYRLWLRLRAGNDSKFNDSVWVQFSGAVDGSGAPLWRTGSGAALLVNLEPCSNCGVSGWGWHNGAWWIGEPAVVRFTAAATQTIRIQTREDGVDVDQIVLSPVTYFDRAPGAVAQDVTIVPKK